MLELDALMHILIISKLGKGIVDEDNIYHWLADSNGYHICLYCGSRVDDLGAGTDQHALDHIKEHNLTAFL